MAETKAVTTKAAAKTKSPAKPKGDGLDGLRKAIAAVDVTESGALDVNDVDNAFAELGGSKVAAFNLTMFAEVVSSMHIEGAEGTEKRQANVLRATKAAIAAIAAFKPKDEIEGMMATQAAAMHFASLECFRRVVQPGQTFDATSKLRRDGANLARGMTDMVEALNRKRGKGPQVVRVERVIVQEGAQAIVGNVSGAPAGAPAALDASGSIPPVTVPGVAQRVGGGDRG
ncbi:hypothetical protein [Muricoccus nepalensis]|uniref:hypothetical protein n=1 Tax=Muricoccus nepalensis TaxID=1854500 RepID=UPI001126AC0D|nr:hypothetical protein [Roseomonas nepalensis]